MKYKQPYLERYSGPASRHECPACNDRRSFTYYLDGNTNQMIHETVGRCDHESRCGYHYPPREYFRDNPQERNRPNSAERALPTPIHKAIRNTEPDYIPRKYLTDSLHYESHFTEFLYSLFGDDTDNLTVERLKFDYHLGGTPSKEVIFWQVDASDKIRTGKIMRYDPETGKRIKSQTGAINWMHAQLKKQGRLPGDFNLVQCFFGEHLLKKHPNRLVALVESEKSAVIAAGVYPDYIWLATGGKSQFAPEKIKPLKGRKVLMFPDADGYQVWRDKAKLLEQLGCSVTLSTLLQQYATPAEQEVQIDIADWIIKDLKQRNISEIQLEISP